MAPSSQELEPPANPGRFSTAVFSPFTFNPSTSLLNPSSLDPNSYSLPLWAGFYLNSSSDSQSFEDRPRELRIAFSDLLDAGGTILIDPNNAFAGECYNCGPVRTLVNDGTKNAVAAIPELST
jgi:hypothetical protein